MSYAPSKFSNRIILPALILFLASASQALALTYSRSPLGTSVANPVTFTVTLTQSELNSIGVDLDPTAAFWCLQPNDLPTSMTGFSESKPISQLSGTFTMILPIAEYASVAVYTAPSDSCTNENVFGGGFNVEGDGSGVIFTVLSPPTPGSGGVAAPVEYRPEVDIFSPAVNSVVGNKLEIKYKAKDANDTLGAAADRFGLGPNPVSIYYIDNIDVVLGKAVAEEDKKLIAKDIAKESAFSWDTADIPNGNSYRIVVDAVDIYGDMGESVSGEFSIDHSQPIFRVEADPAVSRGENVKIKITSSKGLVRPPKVTVTQKGYQPVEIGVIGFKKDFEGTYYVVSGYDGPATISVSGEDISGNSGEIISSGKTFSVGVEPPPKPIIASPLDKDVVASSIISVKGKVREDTEVLITINNKDEQKNLPKADGSFIFENIKLSPDFNGGVNFLSIFSRDAAGNTSEAANLSIKFNLAPELAITSPKKGDILSATTTIKISASDKNNDKLAFTYEASQDDGKNWAMLAENIFKKQYEWRTNNFPDGQYIARVTASDGIAKTIATSSVFSVSNFLPDISFEGGEKSVSNKKDVVINGSVVSPARTNGQANIAGVEYSLDGGKNWQGATVADGAFNSSKENFSVALNDLSEGLYTILFRAKDSRGLSGKAVKTLIVDFGPPVAPIISAPKDGAILSDSDDQDANVAGVQFSISGKSEPKSKVSLVIDGNAFGADTDDKGNFEIKGATLRNHGKNELALFATDIAGNKSPETKISLIYNNPPALKILSPRENRGLNHLAQVRWEATDPDSDEIKDFTLSWRKGKDSEFKILTKNAKNGKFDWDVSSLPQGDDYELRITATDGLSSSEKIAGFLIDNTAPAINIEPLAKSAFSKSFTLEMRGAASDNFSGVEFVEYSLDGEHWFKAIITRGFLEKSAEFTAKHPFLLEDGEYDLRFRSVDAAGNVSAEAIQKITVDTTPPRIGSYTLSSGLITLLPNGESFEAPESVKLKLNISLESDAKNASLVLGDKIFDLAKNSATGLWESEIYLTKGEKTNMLVSAEDFLGNKVKNKEIGKIEAINKGKALDASGQSVADAEINFLIFNPDTKSYAMWQGEAYGEANPIKSGADGEYQAILPPGTYQILVKKQGFERLRTSEFEILNPRFINFDFKLTPRSGFSGFVGDIMDKLNF